MRRLLLCASAVAIALIAVPQLAAARSAMQSGTWTYMDITPDPTTLPNPATEHCHGNLPSAPIDVNTQPIEVKKKRATLSLISHNMLDWAMEIRDANGDTVTGTDSADAQAPENMTISLKKGSYEVIYCSFAGEPQITVDYTLK
ncbi:MAG: hypothetical protein ABR505_12310 [Actinomycetota bacterium]